MTGIRLRGHENTVKSWGSRVLRVKIAVEQLMTVRTYAGRNLWKIDEPASILDVSKQYEKSGKMTVGESGLQTLVVILT